MSNRVHNQPPSGSPLQQQIKRFVGLYEANQLREALALVESLTRDHPNVPILHNMLGVVHLQLGNASEAESCCRKALQLKPDFAEAHNNLGLALQSAGQLNEAITSYQQALKLNPNFTEAYCNLGIVQARAGNNSDAQRNLEFALKQNPDQVVALNELSRVFLTIGQHEKALVLCHRILTIDPGHIEARYRLTAIGNNVSSQPRQYHAEWARNYLHLLSDPRAIRPIRIAAQICRLIKSHSAYVHAANAVKQGQAQANILAICASFSELPLLNCFIEISPMPDLDIETTLKALRHCLLVESQSAATRLPLHPFQQSLALHCFTNEYIYGISDTEARAVSALESRVAASLPAEPDWFGIACLASYRPLQQFAWTQQLQFPESLQQLQDIQIAQPAMEARLASTITTLREPHDNVSIAVQQQYEENPYPRWITTQFEPVRRSFAQVTHALNLQLLADTDLPDCPDILIAGCGTGQQALITASRFSQCQILAVDLSKRSLAYALRKTRELDVQSIDFMQADILDLPALHRQFDIVECGGVLHHMKDPMAGWSAITRCVKPGGLMRIGLYSELARQSVVAARAVIENLGIHASTDDIINFRQYLIASPPAPNSPLKAVINSADFWSTSAIRDLVFHTQEHRFTLPQIKDCLDKLGLLFAGFELANPSLHDAFRNMHPDPAAYYSLDAWHQFETANPEIFAGMYQFWVQKPGK